MTENLLVKILDEITSIKEDMQSLKSQLDENTNLINSIIQHQEDFDSKLASVSMEMDKTYGVITEHDEKLDLIITSQSKQEGTLATLALRSIELETELRNLKKEK